VVLGTLDLLGVDGQDFKSLPLLDRKAKIARLNNVRDDSSVRHLSDV
jgi:hypothetical protein